MGDVAGDLAEARVLAFEFDVAWRTAIRSVALVEREDEHSAPWSKMTTVQVDGRSVTIETSNVPPPGTPRRLYLFAAPPTTEAEASAISSHLAELRDLLDRTSPD